MRFTIKLSRLVLFLLLLLESCNKKMQLDNMGIFREYATIIKASNNEKQLVFIPMHHIGKKEYYEDVKMKIDSFQRNGYGVFFEGVTLSERTDSAYRDTVLRKMRKVLGAHISKEYLKPGGALFGKKHKFLIGLVNQPNSRAIGINIDTGRPVDYSLDELIKAYEGRYETIQLDACDFETPLKDKYNCKTIPGNNARNYIVDTVRNDYVVKEIVRSSEKKILVVYGETHVEGIFKKLYAIDRNWKMTKEFLVY